MANGPRASSRTSVTRRFSSTSPRRAFVVLDKSGTVTGVMSPPRANDVTSMASPSLGATRIDPKGRLIYRSVLPMMFKPPKPGEPFVLPTMADSAPLLRADFDTRRADTLAWVRVPRITVASSSVEGGAGETFRPLFNPLASIDDWAMLPDGSIAILRGRDYHIDWINADGSRVSSPKMPFDWKHLSDDDKVAMIDSSKKALAKQMANGGVGPFPSCRERHPRRQRRGRDGWTLVDDSSRRRTRRRAGAEIHRGDFDARHVEHRACSAE